MRNEEVAAANTFTSTASQHERDSKPMHSFPPATVFQQLQRRQTK